MKKTTTIRPMLAAHMAARGLLRSPATTLLAATILALGLAFPTTFFSFLVGAIRPLPVPEGDRVVRIDVVQPERAGARLEPNADDLRALRGVPGLSALGAFRGFTDVMMDRGTAATRVSGAELTLEVLPLLRVPPVLGRLPEVADRGDALLLGNDVFTEIYGADPAVLGRTVELQGRPRTVVGVMPEGFGFPFNQGVWLVADPDEIEPPIELVGRLADGASLDAVGATFGELWARSDEIRPPERRGGIATVRGFTGGRGEGGEAVAFIGLVLVALCLLLIACANVANLLLVRAAGRLHALGIQAALGAGRGQVALQLFVEALLIAAAGGAAGLGIAWLLVDAVETGLGSVHWGYHWMRMAIDARVIVFTSALVLGTALVAGMLPVARVRRVDVQRVLSEASGAASMGTQGWWARLFVTGQLALSCAALVAAGLAGRSLSTSGDVTGTLPTEQILVSTLTLPEGEPGRAVAAELLARATAEPGVAAAAVTSGAPLLQEPRSPMELDGRTYDRAEDRPTTTWVPVAGDYLGVVDVSLLAGRTFQETDAADAAPVALVNESFVRRFSPDREVLGRRVRISVLDEEWRTVVGVVSDATTGGERVRHDRVYLPRSQATTTDVTLLVRTDGDASVIAPAVRRIVASVDATLAVWSQMTLAETRAYLTRVPRVMSGFALAGGAAGLLVATVGLYGLLAYRIRSRRRELGIRLAIGADGARLARETLVVALRQIVPAVAVGLTLAWLVSPILGALLLGVDPRGWSTYLGVAVAFVLVGTMAAALPALQAYTTEPARVLRGE